MAAVTLRQFVAARNIQHRRLVNVDMSFARPFNHQKYVATGRCPSIHRGLWCWHNAHHNGDHKSLDITVGAQAQYIFWPQTSGDTSKETGDKR